MSEDERAIRDWVATWMAASRAGDTDAVLGLMADDVVFLRPGRAPFGKAEFAAMARQMQGAPVEGTSDIRELRVLGDWAYLQNYIDVSITPPGASAPLRRAGQTLTLLRKDNGRWLLARDANLVMAVG